MKVFWKQASLSDESAPEDLEKEKRQYASLEEAAPLAVQAQEPDVEAVVEKLRDRRSRVRNGLTYWMWRILTLVLGVCSLYLFCCIPVGTLPIALTTLYFWATIRVIGKSSETLRMERAALRNSQLGKEWIGSLCEALEWPDQQAQGSAALLLAQLLPRLGAADAGLLSQEQLVCLYGRLSPLKAWAHPELAHAILRLLPIFGTEDALPFVERLASLPAITRKGRGLRSGAREIHALLEKRILASREERRVEASQPPVSIAPVLELQVGARQSDPSENDQGGVTEVNAQLNKDLEEFEAEIKKVKTPGMRFGYLIATWCVVVPYALYQTIFQFIDGNWIGGVVFTIITVLSTQFHRLTLMGQHSILARRLAKIDDVRCIGRLAEVLEWPDEMEKDVATSALSRLLPKVRASDKIFQTPQQRMNLNRMLTLKNARRHAGFLVDLLKALEQIGDETSLPFVQQLASATPATAQQRRVCDAARECLPYLELRSDLSRDSQTLLRASSALNVNADHLVRPASGGGVTDKKELLRASVGRDEA